MSSLARAHMMPNHRTCRGRWLKLTRAAHWQVVFIRRVGHLLQAISDQTKQICVPAWRLVAFMFHPLLSGQSMGRCLLPKNAGLGHERLQMWGSPC